MTGNTPQSGVPGAQLGQQPPKQQSGNVVNEIASALSDAQTVAICLPQQAPMDAVASGLALYYALSKLGKTVTVVSQDRIDPAMDLIGQEFITNTLGSDGNVLVVSIPYKNGGIENVSYAIEGDKLNIVIRPDAAQESINKDDLGFAYSGGKPDVIVALYAPSLQSLGTVYSQNTPLFETTKVISIDRHFTSTEYGIFNYIDKNSPAIAQMVNDILRIMKVELDENISNNLYDGLVVATQNFTSYATDAKSFRMAAYLLEHGATKRQPVGEAQQSTPMGLAQGGIAASQLPQAMPMSQVPQANPQPSSQVADPLKPQIFGNGQAPETIQETQSAQTIQVPQSAENVSMQQPQDQQEVQPVDAPKQKVEAPDMDMPQSLQGMGSLNKG